MNKSSFKFSWEDTLLEMLPSRALFLPETKELLICDIHLGKAEYFQQNGIPLTNNSDKNNFARIKKIVKECSPEKLIILGDLFHSKYSIDKTLQKKFEDLPELLKTNVELVLGNQHTRSKSPQRMGFRNYPHAWPVADWYDKQLDKCNEKTARSI